MKKIGIDYSMRNKRGLIEAYIELPVCKRAQKHLIDNDKSNFNYDKFYNETKLKDALRAICELQDGIFQEIITIEEI